jgi:hypothetical protein
MGMQLVGKLSIETIDCYQRLELLLIAISNPSYYYYFDNLLPI